MGVGYRLLFYRWRYSELSSRLSAHLLLSIIRNQYITGERLMWLNFGCYNSPKIVG